ncbi:hypothetical protein D9M68_995930 [compost metagenome]
MDVLEVQIQQQPIITTQIEAAQVAAQIPLLILVQGSQLKLDQLPEPLIDARQVGLASRGAERQHLHGAHLSHSRMALRV